MYQLNNISNNFGFFINLYFLAVEDKVSSMNTYEKSFIATVVALIVVCCFQPSPALAQSIIKVSGTVKDTDGYPLVGAVVQCASTKAATVVDLDGNYAISAPSGSFLVYSFLGMEEQKIKADKAVINVVLVSDNKLEASVINAGYGVIQNKENLTGSAFEVKGEDLKIKPSSRLDDLLVGQVPGLNVIEDNSTGRPTVKIRIRGDGSLSASSEPLWVIDGVPVYTGSRINSVAGTSYTVSPLSYMNPDDIESMTVLKDASTTALYGADGANGVILVTTKKAQSGKTSYNISFKYGLSDMDRSTTIKWVTADQWRQLSMEGWTNSGRPAAAYPYQDNEHNSYSTTNTDWFDEYYGVGQTTEVNFSASTGTKTLDNFLSLGYFGSTSPVIGNNQTRYSARDKVTLKFTDWFKTELNLSGNYSVNDLFSVGRSYLEVIPIFEPYNADGSYRLYNYYSSKDDVYEETSHKFIYNEVPTREENDNSQYSLSTDVSANLILTPFKGMTITSQTGVSMINIYEATYASSKTLDGLSSDSSKNGSSHRSGVFSSVINENLRANYSQTFAQKWAVSAMAGVEWTDKVHKYLNGYGYGFANDHIKELAYANKATLSITSNKTETKSLSYIAYGSLTYDRRYSLTASYRRQGNSAFSEFSRWADFTSIGFVWNVHRENFFNVPWINTLNFKASYGNNGNSRIDTSSSYGSYSISSGAYYGGKPGAVQDSPANPGLSWETTYITNIGTNVGLFNRVNISAEWYNRRTANLLYSGRVSSVITDGSVLRNVGEITNNGVEFTVDVDIIKGKDFNWDFSINGAHNSNMITKLYKDMHTGFFDSIWVEGASKDAWWLIRWAGVDPVTGAPMWYDKNGNLTYTFNYDDRVLLPEYSKEPKVYGGVTNDFKYKNWSLRVMFDYSFGSWDYDIALNDDGQDCIDSNITVDALNHWTTVGEPNINTKYAYNHGTLSYYNSTRALVNASYIQIRSVALNYRFPDKWCKAMKMSNLTASLIGDNLYLWTPGQYSKVNSYKNIKYSSGMRRGLSLKLAVNF